MKKEKKILYLDQFAVSNMYDAAPSSTWGLLRQTIHEKVNKGVLSCPMPLEGLYETVGRSNKDKTRCQGTGHRHQSEVRMREE